MASTLRKGQSEADTLAEMNFLISDTELQIPKSVRRKMIAGKLLKKRTYMTRKDFEGQANRLYKCCLKSIRDMHELHLKRILGMEIIEDIILRADSYYITIPHVIHITWSIMSCIHHFQLRVRSKSNPLVKYVRRRKTEQSMKIYSKLIRLFRPSTHRIVLNAIITFYKEGKLWEIEFACTDLITDLLRIYYDKESAIRDIIFTAELATLINVEEAKNLVQVLYEIFLKTNLKNVSRSLMKKFLDMLKSSVMAQADDEFNYAPLKDGVLLSLRNIIAKLNNKSLMKIIAVILSYLFNERSDEIIVVFGNLSIHAADKYKMKSYFKDLPQSMLNQLTSILKAKNITALQIFTRMWLNLTDRRNNALKFQTPRIYFMDCNYGILIKKCRVDDKKFFLQFRQFFYEITVTSFKHLTRRLAFEHVFQQAAVLMVDIPCGYTASTYVSVALTVQDYALTITTVNLIKSHHLHAIVLSLMSLICYVHKAKVFYEYVNKVMERRAEWAPHLNPPLKETYEYAQHHVLWNRPDLFFEDWEARYGLWKCFRVKGKYRHKNKTK